MALLLLVAGCGSPSATATHDTGPSSSATVPALEGPKPAAELPENQGVDAAVLSGTTAWVLATGQRGALSIRKVPVDGSSTVAVGADELKDLSPSTVAIAAWPQGVIVTGERCDGHAASECVKDSGIVELRDLDGKLAKRLVLWDKVKTQAGGSSPTFLGVDGTDAWIRGQDAVVKIDRSGRIVTQVPFTASAQTCVQAGELYRVETDGPTLDESDPHGVPGSFTEDDLKSLPPATISIQRWTGSVWRSVPNGEFTSTGSFPEVKCRGSAVTLWSENDLEAIWTAEGGWSNATSPSEPLQQPTNVHGQMAPAIADNGAVYRLGDDFHLRRLDSSNGTWVDTGLKLEPTTANTKSFISVVVAGDGPNLFACAQRATGLPGGPSEPGTVCGFAPVPG